MDEKTLYVIPQRGVSGWYSGYIKDAGGPHQVFSTNAALLFMSVQHYTDDGYAVKFTDASSLAPFLAKKPDFLEQMKTWLLYAEP